MNNKIKKAVIPVAGLGTRMLPATKAIPKEMLPLVDKPLIQYIVNECVNAGIKEIVLVTHSSKNAIENHFDTSFELEATLEARVKRQLLDEVQAICPKDVTIMHVRQGQAKGLGHAVLCAKPLVGDEPFAVVLPDVILDEYTADQSKENLAAMINHFEQTGASQIMVEPVPMSDVSKYGVVDCNGTELKAGESCPMACMVEKPAIEDAPSNLAVVGRYVLSHNIWDKLAMTPPGAGDEVQLTDAIDMLMQDETVEAFHMTGRSHDCGDKLGYAKAFVEYGMRDKALGEAFTAYIKTLNDTSFTDGLDLTPLSEKTDA
ncbi:UTP--glucose-1-phosphate uridylyltransferase GalU [Photobacterium leiognathi]|uniref:UTP--glucose-1-phosphate uridylyltransferase GalU n=1 Tax=Photobacterium leiognathi TaxID=553611 RepID=UPI0029829247|nr:UTP--glucose-1-phosphate uridylyltransferase GalU [Photobacterium leiognathi]